MLSRSSNTGQVLAVLVFFLKRLLTSVVVVLISTFVMYVLVDLSIDPLADLRTSTAPNKDQQIANRIAQLHLDEPRPDPLLLLAQGRERVRLRQLRPRRELADPPVDHQPDQRRGRAPPSSWSAPPPSSRSCSACWSASSARCGSTPASTTRSPSCPSCCTPCPSSGSRCWPRCSWRSTSTTSSPTRHIPIPVIVGSAVLVGITVSSAVGGAITPRLRNFAISAFVVVLLLTYTNLTDWFTRPVHRHRAAGRELRRVGLPGDLAEHRSAQPSGALLRADRRGPGGRALAADALRLGLRQGCGHPRLAARDRAVPGGRSPSASGSGTRGAARTVLGPHGPRP